MEVGLALPELAGYWEVEGYLKVNWNILRKCGCSVDNSAHYNLWALKFHNTTHNSQNKGQMHWPDVQPPSPLAFNLSFTAWPRSFPPRTSHSSLTAWFYPSLVFALAILCLENLSTLSKKCGSDRKPSLSTTTTTLHQWGGARAAIPSVSIRGRCEIVCTAWLHSYPSPQGPCPAPGK